MYYINGYNYEIELEMGTFGWDWEKKSWRLLHWSLLGPMVIFWNLLFIENVVFLVKRRKMKSQLNSLTNLKMSFIWSVRNKKTEAAKVVLI